MVDKIVQNMDCMVFLLAKAYQKGNRLVQARLKPHGLTNVQYVVLEMLWLRPGLSAKELGRVLTIDKATMSGILDRMAEAGWLIKAQDSEDRRVLRLRTSDRADALKEELTAERQVANEELLEGFTMEEKILLRRLLLAMID